MKLKKLNLKELNNDSVLGKVAGGCPPTIHGCDFDRTIPEFAN
ncbi:hypothetical protein [Pseudoalteromonas xiamenensis]|nr:hypothetical protein [Pseudoalteromonas xiamenensis]